MRRLVLAAAAVAAMLFSFASPPVHADDASPSSGDSLLQIQDRTIEAANRILAGTPTPDGWQIRHVCLSTEQLNRYWCVFVPFPY